MLVQKGPVPVRQAVFPSADWPTDADLADKEGSIGLERGDTMKQIRRNLYASVGGLGLMFGFGGTCLPDNYFALTARNLTVAVADSLVEIAVAPFFDALAPDSGTTDDTTDADDAAGTDG